MLVWRTGSGTETKHSTCCLDFVWLARGFYFIKVRGRIQSRGTHAHGAVFDQSWFSVCSIAYCCQTHWSSLQAMKLALRGVTIITASGDDGVRGDTFECYQQATSCISTHEPSSSIKHQSPHFLIIINHHPHSCCAPQSLIVINRPHADAHSLSDRSSSVSTQPPSNAPARCSSINNYTACHVLLVAIMVCLALNTLAVHGINGTPPSLIAL